MPGERGLWYETSFLEGASRMRPTIAGPGLTPGPLRRPVSTGDLRATPCDLAEVDLPGVRPRMTGESPVPLLRGGRREGPVATECAAEGSHAPPVALRRGGWTYTRCALDPEQLFDLEADSHELTTSRAGEPVPSPWPTSGTSTPGSARARPGVASSTTRCARAATTPGTGSRSTSPPDVTCEIT